MKLSFINRQCCSKQWLNSSPKLLRLKAYTEISEASDRDIANKTLNHGVMDCKLVFYCLLLFLSLASAGLNFYISHQESFRVLGMCLYSFGENFD